MPWRTAVYARLLGISVLRAVVMACRANLVATIIVVGLAYLLFGMAAAH
jgi:hypothetical protein